MPEEFVLLKSLAGSLSHLYALQISLEHGVEVIEPYALGSVVTGAFVVGLRSELVQPSKGSVKLALVGELKWKDETTVALKKDDCLERDAKALNTNELLNFLKVSPDFLYEGRSIFDQQALEKGKVWRDLSLGNMFKRADSSPYPGQELITAVCSFLVNTRLKKDPDLKATLQHVNISPEEMNRALKATAGVISRVIHDAICSGSGITIETIGTFRPAPDLDFDPDAELLSLAKAWRRETPSPQYSTSLK